MANRHHNKLKSPSQPDNGVKNHQKELNVNASLSYPIEAIKIGERFRKDFGDLKPFAHNIEEIGLLHPLTILRTGELATGLRRLEACKLLGLQNIPVTFVDGSETWKYEIAENHFRKNNTASEMVKSKRFLESKMKRGQVKRTDLETCVNFTQVKGMKTRDIIASILGTSGLTFRRWRRSLKHLKKIRSIGNCWSKLIQERGAWIRHFARLLKKSKEMKEMKNSAK
jgi:hypothetical protein